METPAVYLVTQTPWATGSTEFAGVFDTEESAQTAIDARDFGHSWYAIYPFTLNVMMPEKPTPLLGAYYYNPGKGREEVSWT